MLRLCEKILYFFVEFRRYTKSNQIYPLGTFLDIHNFVLELVYSLVVSYCKHLVN